MHQQLGRNSRPPFLKGPTSSFFFVSTEITSSPGRVAVGPVQMLKLGVAVRVFRPRHLQSYSPSNRAVNLRPHGWSAPPADSMFWDPSDQSSLSGALATWHAR